MLLEETGPQLNFNMTRDRGQSRTVESYIKKEKKNVDKEKDTKKW